MRQPTISARLVVLDVGHGNAALLHENDVTVLIDAASRSHVLEYLKEQAISSIDLVIISHSDQDHIGGLIGLLNNGIKIGKVRVNSDADKSSEAWRDLVFALEDARRAGSLLFEVGLSVGPIAIHGLVRSSAEIIAPSPGLAALGAGAHSKCGRRITSNSISASVKISFDQKPVALLTGDMDCVALDDAAEAGADLAAPLLIFPHHGGLPGEGAPQKFAEKLIKLVKPSFVIFSLGRAPHENPQPDIIEVVRSSGAYIACTQLSKRCSKLIPTEVANAVNRVYSAGTTTNSCCAGSMVFNLECAHTGFLTHTSHISFVKDFIKEALCSKNI